MKDEFCIMPDSCLYETKRRNGLERHEVFFGSGRRKKSIDRGLVVFLTPEQHRGAQGAHQNRTYDLALKRIAQRAAMQYYGWTADKFREIFGKSYL